MTVTAEIDNQCPENWAPTESMCNEWVEATLHHLSRETNCLISLRIVSANESADLNHKYRNISAATNVLSFPMEIPPEVTAQMDAVPLGDLVICPTIVEDEANAQQKSLADHWTHLVVHGCLHLLGYDHQLEEAAIEMENLEIEILKKLGISNPYLIG